MSRRRPGYRRPLMDDLPLTPLIDMALTLLIIFMITSPALHNAVQIDLPQGSVSDTNNKEEIIIFMDKHEQLYLNELPVSRDQLLTDLSLERLDRSDGMVHVKADKAVAYGCVVGLVDKIKDTCGVRCVALATKHRV